MLKQLKVYVYILLATCLVFCFLHVDFSSAVSAAAFPVGIVFCAILAYLLLKKCMHSHSCTVLPIIRKMLEYLPFILLAVFIFKRAGLSDGGFVYDLFCVLLWIVSVVVTFLILHHLDEKRVYRDNPFFVQPIAPANSSRSGLRRIVREILEWGDAFLQAVCIVTLITIFIFQPYEIPSESMVPEFLVHDRVVVLKTLSGPSFPLSHVALPRIRSYARGDIVVFRNPHYATGRVTEVRNFVAQLVFMLTFTKVNLNVDENGELKPDPLVKRLTGVPGEQLMMQDGILYSRTRDNHEFSPVQSDSRWALWNANTLPQKTLAHVEYLPVTQNQYDIMTAWEQERNSLSYDRAVAEASELVERFTAAAE
jgi:signal peptidase I